MKNKVYKLTVIGFWLPIILALAIFSASAYWDFSSPKTNDFWLQRSGAVISLLGAWITLYGTKFQMQVEEDTLHIHTKLPFNIWSFLLIVLGTILCGYGDLLVYKIKLIH